MNVAVSNNRVNDYFGDIVAAEQTHKELFIYGGAGSGKSYAIAQLILLLALTQSYFRCVYMRKVARTIRASQFMLFQDVINSWNLEKYFKVNRGDMIITSFNGNMLIPMGADNIDKLKSIQEPTHFWLEETTEFSLNDYKQVRLRLRTKKGRNCVLSTFNPVSKNHWLFKYISSKDNVYTMKSTYIDNKFIDASYRKTLEELKFIDEDYYNVYALGEWGIGSRDAVFSNYTFGEFKDIGEVFYGIDFGYTNPTAIVECREYDGKIYARELLYEKGLTNTQLLQHIDKMIKNKTAPIYCDSEDRNRIEELFNKGYYVYPAYKDIMHGISIVNSFELVIDSQSSNMIKEIETYTFMKDKDGNVIEKPVKFNDHLMDALRYAIATHYKDKPMKPQVKIFKKHKTL